uniref:RxLR effector protein n=1 Tax=Hyaloperonospora arabidopsidis (strain Emoy2) TaxID=559515 RepID=A0A090B8Y2_HYAAE|nr:RxLR effector candidate protein [Hyaloperonospora arabidopsidis Emoy2]
MRLPYLALTALVAVFSSGDAVSTAVGSESVYESDVPLVLCETDESVNRANTQRFLRATVVTRDSVSMPTIMEEGMVTFPSVLCMSFSATIEKVKFSMATLEKGGKATEAMITVMSNLAESIRQATGSQAEELGLGVIIYKALHEHRNQHVFVDRVSRNKTRKELLKRIRIDHVTACLQ